MENIAYRQGRLDQALWMLERVSAWLRLHRYTVEMIPPEVRVFLAELLAANLTEAQHGTQSPEHIEVGA